MSVPAPNLQNMTIPQLLQALTAGAVGSAMHQQAAFMLQFRIAEKHAEAGAQGATASNVMATATRDLARFTRALVWATWALFLVGGTTAALTIIQVLKALGLIR